MSRYELLMLWRRLDADGSGEAKVLVGGVLVRFWSVFFLKKKTFKRKKKVLVGIFIQLDHFGRFCFGFGAVLVFFLF